MNRGRAANNIQANQQLRKKVNSWRWAIFGILSSWRCYAPRRPRRHKDHEHQNTKYNQGWRSHFFPRYVAVNRSVGRGIDLIRRWRRLKVNRWMGVGWRGHVITRPWMWLRAKPWNWNRLEAVWGSQANHFIITSPTQSALFEHAFRSCQPCWMPVANTNIARTRPRNCESSIIYDVYILCVQLQLYARSISRGRLYLHPHFFVHEVHLVFS